MTSAIYSQCVTVEDNLSLKLPCVEYNGNHYQLHLTSYHNSVDPDCLYWQYESVQSVTVETIVYAFTGTRNQMEDLQAAYEKAVYDYDNDTHQFINLTNGNTVLEKSFLDGLKDYLNDGTHSLVCTSSVTREKLIDFLKVEDFHGFATAMESCNGEKDDWEIAFKTVLDDG